MSRLDGLWSGLGAPLRSRPPKTTGACPQALIGTLLCGLLLIAPATSAGPTQAEQARDKLIDKLADSRQPAHQRVVAQLRSSGGQWASFEGRIEILYEDYGDDARPVLRQTLHSKSGQRFELMPGDGAPAFLHGDRVQLAGFAVADEEQDLTYLAFDANGDGVAVTASPSPSQTQGDQRTLVIAVNFADKATQPFSTAQVNDTVFNQAAAYFEEASFNNMGLSGDVYGWYTLPLSSTACDTDTLASEAKARAQADGANLADYQRLVYVFPKNGCGWSGLASLGGTPSTVFLNGTLDLHIVTHEIGHTLGLDHAMGLECGAETLGDNCTWAGQGDYLDSMGGELGHFNSSRKEWLGWYDSGNPLEITASGNYRIEPYAAAAGNLPKALKIYRGKDPDTGYDEWLTVEYRQAVGFDDNILVSSVDSSNVLNGAVVHLVQDGYIQRSWILDMNPDSTFPDFVDPALEVGSSFTDPATGITIATLSSDGSVAEVSVTLPHDVTAACATASPDITLAASGDSVAAAGDTLAYQITVTNRDSSDCDAASFDLSAAVPSGWTYTLGTAVLNLAPGASGSTALHVTSAGAAIDGAYIIEVTTSQRESGKSATASATYTVNTPEEPTANTAPAAVNDSASTAKNTAAAIPVLANDSDPDGDALTLVAVTQPASKASVSINSDGTVLYTPHPRFTGTDTFSYTISDGKLQASASVTVTVGASDTTTDDGGSTGGGNNGGGKGKNK